MLAPTHLAIAAGPSYGVANDTVRHRGAVPPRAVAEAVPQHCQAEARMAGANIFSLFCLVFFYTTPALKRSL